jgi:integrase
MSCKITFHDGYVKMHYQVNKERVRFTTGVPISSRSDLSRDGKLKSTIKDKERHQETIDALKYKIESIIKDYKNSYGIAPSVPELKKLFENYKNKLYNSDKLLDFYCTYYDTKVEFFKGRDKSEKSIKDYRGLKYYLEDFQVYQNGPIYLNDISKDWLIRFKNFLEQKRENSGNKIYKTFGGIKSSTLKKKLNLFISFLKWLDENKHSSFPSGLSNFSRDIKNAVVEKATLTKEEVNKLYRLKITDKKEKYIRDVFVLSCFTGLRWSDLTTLKKSNIKTIGDKQAIVKKAEKTKHQFTVFLNKISLEICENYNFDFTLLENSNFNKYLKLLLSKTGWFNDETDFTNEDGRLLKRYETISVHRGRDTFITLLIEERVPVNAIMKYTGHQSVSNLNKYIDTKKNVQDFTNELII